MDVSCLILGLFWLVDQDHRRVGRIGQLLIALKMQVFIPGFIPAFIRACDRYIFSDIAVLNRYAGKIKAR
ncbi:hypothetical protein TALK_13190 [Thalassospira alkalitolerans]|uniref:Uncharacterized protein n=1 Tax=Thalassospira alkalitolerans TaxID=1293890 RepID=A0A1Y2LA92_9PROT|nr:hypothetical protein TALK_13190 [Thalassospira alkalitolerans]